MSKESKSYPVAHRQLESRRGVRLGGWGNNDRKVLTLKCVFPTFKELLKKQVGDLRLELKVLLVLQDTHVDDDMLSSVTHNLTLKGIGSIGTKGSGLFFDPIEVTEVWADAFLSGGIIRLGHRGLNAARNVIDTKKLKIRQRSKKNGIIKSTLLTKKACLFKRGIQNRNDKLEKLNDRKTAALETILDLKFNRKYIEGILDSFEKMQTVGDDHEYKEPRIVYWIDYPEFCMHNRGKHPRGKFIALPGQTVISIDTDPIRYQLGSSLGTNLLSTEA